MRVGNKRNRAGESARVDERAAVTDTHALLYHAAGGQRLGAKAKAYFAAAEEGTALIYVPMAVLMEIVFLDRVGRGGLRVRPAEFFGTLFLNPAYQPMDLTIEQVVLAADIRCNRDPYDSLVVAAAQVLMLPLITRDSEIAAADVVKVIW